MRSFEGPERSGTVVPGVTGRLLGPVGPFLRIVPTVGIFPDQDWWAAADCSPVLAGRTDIPMVPPITTCDEEWLEVHVVFLRGTAKCTQAPGSSKACAFSTRRAMNEWSRVWSCRYSAHNGESGMKATETKSVLWPHRWPRRMRRVSFCAAWTAIIATSLDKLASPDCNNRRGVAATIVEAHGVANSKRKTRQREGKKRWLICRQGQLWATNWSTGYRIEKRGRGDHG